MTRYRSHGILNIKIFLQSIAIAVVTGNNHLVWADGIDYDTNYLGLLALSFHKSVALGKSHLQLRDFIDGNLNTNVVAYGAIAARKSATLTSSLANSIPYQIQDTIGSTLDKIRGTPAETAVKTVTYEGISVIGDFVYGLAFAGLSGGITLATASVLSEPTLYFMHETAWASLDQRKQQPTDSVAKLKKPSLYEALPIPTKTTSFAVANVARILTAAWLATGSPLVTIGFLAFSSLEDSASYSANEMLWNQISPLSPPLLRGKD
ncbi:hypothetical protein TI04_04990 [Achromatium sp. WMS2]|nr:hypothetical protein TI04_04990 [Achromatium sp. WMS2]